MTWRSLKDDPPKHDGAILLYSSGEQWFDMAGNAVSFGAVRDHAERAEVAFVEDGEIREAGTAHPLWERGTDEVWMPTHWMPLPDPPTTPPPETTP